MHQTLLTCAISIVLISSAYSQQKQGVSIEKAVTPQYAGTFSPQTGFISTKNQNRMGTDLVVNNAIQSNYFAIPGMDQEWVDNNILMDTNGNGFESVNGLIFNYCSTDINPLGLQQTIHVYDDSVYCNGPVNWPVADCSYNITNLPGSTNGMTTCWEIEVDLIGVECDLTDGHGGSAGWGQVWDNNLTGPVLSSGGNGQTNSFTWFETNTKIFIGCYWFGGSPWAGFDMQMYSGNSALTLTTTGSPGGPMTFDVSGATPQEIVALMYAYGRGAHVVNNPISGNIVVTGLADRGFDVADYHDADHNGNYSFSAFVSSAAANLVSVQAIDASNDGLSNVVDL
ncbi:MAG: hypothetical protein HQ519_09710 [Planctomycetes bacterium]|nr:hypothetical protein [Planctomycetota bacterium]